MPTRHSGSTREVRALDAFIKLSRAVRTVGGEMQKSFVASGLTEGQFGVLEALLHAGPLGQKELGSKLLCSPANLCTVLDNLEKMDYVTRVRDDQDRRNVIVSLTPIGRQTIKRAFPAHAAHIADLMNALTPAEQDALGALCKKLGLTVSQR